MQEAKVSVFTATLLNINLMVGAGIYITPKLMAQKAGSISYLGWVGSALILLPIVLCIVEMAKYFPGEGSFYNYTKKGLGKTIGFLSGWIYFLGYVAIQAMQMLSMREILIQSLGLNWINSHYLIFNTLFFAGICSISLLSLGLVGKIQNILTFLKLLPVLFVIGIILIYSFPADIPSVNSSFFNLHYTIPLAVFGYWGFEGAASISHRIKGNPKNASRSILIAFFITMLIFTVFNFGVLRIMGAKNLALLGAPSFVSFLPFQVTWLIKIIPIIIAIAITNSIYAELTSFSFLLQAMANEKLLFFSSVISKVNKNNQPIVAIFLQAGLGYLFVTLINNINILLAISNLGLLVTFVLTLISLFIIQKRQRNSLGLLKTILGFISCGVLGYYSYNEIDKAIYILAFVAVIIIGLVLYKINEKNIGYEK